MSGTDHRRNPFLALQALRGNACERSQPAPLRKAQRRGDRFRLGVRVRGRAIRISNPGGAQLIREAPFAVAAHRERSRLAQRIGRVVDIAERREAVGQRLEIGLAVPAPPAFAELARQVGTQLGPRRRILAGIAQRELLQSRLVERRRIVLGPGTCCHAVFVPQSPPKRKQPHLLRLHAN